jgi:hypothetical protein
MDNIKDILERYKNNSFNKESNKNHPISQRHQLIDKFAQKLNAKRVENGFKPLTHAFLNKKMAESGLKTDSDLYWFYKYCDETKNFDKVWWWSLKPQKSRN